jgi:hypothetical protein
VEASDIDHINFFRNCKQPRSVTVEYFSASAFLLRTT